MTIIFNQNGQKLSLWMKIVGIVLICSMIEQMKGNAIGVLIMPLSSFHSVSIIFKKREIQMLLNVESFLFLKEYFYAGAFSQNISSIFATLNM